MKTPSPEICEDFTLPEISRFVSFGSSKSFRRAAAMLWVAFLPMFVSQNAISQVTISMTGSGLIQLNYNGHNFIPALANAGNPELHLKYKQNGAGNEIFLYDGGTKAWDTVAQTHTRTWSGLAQCVLKYTVTGDRLTISGTLTNTSAADAITTLSGSMITRIKFPSDTTVPGKPDNWQSGAVGTFADFASSTVCPGVLDYVYDNLYVPGAVYWGTYHPTNQWPSYFDRYLPQSKKVLTPGENAVWSVSYRFAPAGTTQASLESDILAKRAALNPSIITWSDHRAIGRWFVASDGTHPVNNPRGWFTNDASTNTTTPSGIAAFCSALLSRAQICATTNTNMDGQGVIVWDIEGQQFGHPISYLGFPIFRSVPVATVGAVAGIGLPPEMETPYLYNGVTKPVIDHMFDILKTTGEAGICLRPTLALMRAYASSTSSLIHYVEYDWTQSLIDKITYAKNRWGCKLYYVDSNIAYPYGGGVYAAADFRKVAEAHPDVLLMPEWRDQQHIYYSFSAPYKTSHVGEGPTSPGVYDVYPNAFSACAASESFLQSNHAAFVNGVRNGDILFYDAWWPAPQNDDVKAIYEEAAGDP